MATLRIFDAIYDDSYLDRFFTPGTHGKVISHTAHQFKYFAPDGTIVTVNGSGFTYDAAGHPNLPGGHISSILVKTYGGDLLLRISHIPPNVGLFFFYQNTFVHPNLDHLLNKIFVGNDIITGSNHNDFLAFGAGKGSETVHAGGGNDWVFGDSIGNDHLFGGLGVDVLTYSNYWTSHPVGASGVVIDAALGTATTPGGVDTFAEFEGYRGTRFADQIYGSAKDEELAGFRGNDIIDGRGGFDTLWYFDDKAFGGTLGIEVNLGSGLIRDGFGTFDTVSNIEGVIGTAFNDVLSGSFGDDRFWGLGGVDSFDDGGGGSHDAILFNIIGRFGANHGVQVDLQLSLNQIINDGYNNTETALGFEDLVGSDFADTLQGDGKANRFYGADGDDTLAGRGGTDLLSGSGGNDFLDGGDGADTLLGDRGADKFVFSVAPTSPDYVVDFSGLNSEGDTILLSLAVFSALTGTAGNAMTAGEFTEGSDATAASHHVIWDSTNDDLYYDPTGDTVGGDKVLIAHFGNDPAISAADIFLIA